MMTFYVSPNGNGSGTNFQDPTDYTSSSFWSNVRNELTNQTVVVLFQNGIYESPLPNFTGVGNSNYRLFIEASEPYKAIFRIPDNDPPLDHLSYEELKGRDEVIAHLFIFRECQNILLRGFLFTGNGLIRYVTQFRKGSKNITIEECKFNNLPNVILGASGAADKGTDYITFKSCDFKKVGRDGHAHMIYNAYQPQHIKVLDCKFEDCSGDFVRFRDRSDYCVVNGCTFIQNGNYPNSGSENRPFVSIPLFNDVEVKPGETSPEILRQAEYFGTNFVISSNKFIYKKRGGKRYAVYFLHQGFNPPGRNHLLTKKEGQVLMGGSDKKRKELLKNNFGIETAKVKVYDNYYDCVKMKVVLESVPGYGSPYKGWQGSVNISNLINNDPVLNPPQWMPVFSSL